MAPVLAPPRPAEPADFTDDIDNALTAFREDVSYAILMARSAVTITNKRKAWQKNANQ